MLTRDYHGFKLDEALRDADGIVASIRLRKQVQDVCFIVGHGVIRQELIKLLQNYSLTPSVKLDNAGCITCIIE